MNWLIRTVAASQQDREFDTVSVTLGGLDADIPLVEAALNGGYLQLTAGKGGKCTLSSRNGAGIARQALAPGDSLKIGGSELRVVAPPAGFDIAIEILVNSKAASVSRARMERDLSPALPSRRFWSYAIVLILLAMGLALPLVGFFNPDVEDKLRYSGLPTDQFWLSGPLSSPHQTPAMLNNCGSCHQKAFEMSPSRACLQCHQKTPEHFLSEHHSAMAEAHTLQRCSSCHKEHNEPANLIVTSDGLCVDCHTNSLPRHSGFTAEDDIEAVTGFNREEHPEFMVALLKQQLSGWQNERREQTVALKEVSNLKFPHDVHLDPDKVYFADDRPAVCADCHTLRKDGEHFEPVTMETSCRGCHDMGFDPDREPAAAERQLPHAAPELVYEHLREFHISRAAQHVAQSQVRRLPGVVKPDRSCQKDAVSCGTEQAQRDMGRLFETAGCVSCHAVYKKDDRWQVKKVRLQEDWRPLAKFDHRAHLVGEETDEQQLCLNCHKAKKSDTATDILMPSIDGCLDCHSDRPEAEQHSSSVQLSCIGCHDFHVDGLRSMKAAK